MNRNKICWLLILWAASNATIKGQTFQNLYSFSCVWDDNTGWNCTREGIGPEGALIQGKDGDFYGTLTGGGPWGNGGVFKMTPEGNLTMMAFFNGTNGWSPHGGLLQASDGYFYGATWGGYGDTLFRMTPGGAVNSLVGFSPGTNPMGELAEGQDGFLYGVTWHGGCSQWDDGTIFRISTNGSLQTLHCFSGADGYNPSGGLLLASDGNFYGVTAGGGLGYGTAYRLTTNGVLTTLAMFPDGPNGAAWPVGKLIEAPDGNLYGVADTTTHIGGVFRLSKEGTLTTVADFRLNYGGEHPVGPLVLANDGNFYGCCYYGGNFTVSPTPCGTIFRMSPAGEVTMLFSLTAYWPPYPGAYPYAGLVQGTDGNLYGTTEQGGAGEAGNIFRINMPGPQLSLTHSGRDLVLSWRTNYTGYFLQSSAELRSNHWTDCTNLVSSKEGIYFVTNPVSATSRFFRLSRISQPSTNGTEGERHHGQPARHEHLERHGKK